MLIWWNVKINLDAEFNLVFKMLAHCLLNDTNIINFTMYRIYKFFLCETAKEGIMGAITGRAIYEGTPDFAEAQKLADSTCTYVESE